ncbi:MAG: hypothetical protein IJ859_04185 [Synergistaceae bacterium]|nr:hypothetical protein [Synergistaceae bacterium]
MELVRCRLCGNLRANGSDHYRICRNCRHRLDDIYGRVHEYLRDNEDDDFDIYRLGEAMDIDTADIQALVDLGYLERDLKTYGSRKATDREKLAAEFSGELQKMKKTPTSYGGSVYSRGREKDNGERHYLYDKQKKQ